MTCADNCSSYSHDRAAMVAAAALAGLAGWLFGWGCCGKGCHQSSPRSPPPRLLFLLRTTNQIQMHIPNNRCAQRVVPLMKLWSTALCTPPYSRRVTDRSTGVPLLAPTIPTKKDPGAFSRRRAGPRLEIKFALEIDLSIAVKIGREIRWPMVIERGGEMVEENTLRDDVALRGSEEERVRE